MYSNSLVFLSQHQPRPSGPSRGPTCYAWMFRSAKPCMMTMHWQSCRAFCEARRSGLKSGRVSPECCFLEQKYRGLASEKEWDSILHRGAWLFFLYHIRIYNYIITYICSMTWNGAMYKVRSPGNPTLFDSCRHGDFFASPYPDVPLLKATNLQASGAVAKCDPFSARARACDTSISEPHEAGCDALVEVITDGGSKCLGYLVM